jgi:hypothetical protein
MKRISDRDISKRRPFSRLSAKALDVFHAVLRFPFKLVATILKRAAQVLLSIFIVILHPGFKWLLKLLTRSRIVRNYIKPAIQKIAERYYEPYFVFLRGLPPYWATFSIALPLAALEPAKLYATILIAERPKAGIVLWLVLQGLSLVLIDKTWTAVRPQSRKIWLVSRVHAWGWLNVSYGKYWIKSSVFYRAIIRWKERVQVAAQALWAQLSTLRRARRL